jgi:tRNA pseudouridine38-40 synthase
MNYKLKISYNGENYSGWQIQPDKRTVQGEIEKSFVDIFGEKIDLIGSGRTDSGVHAYNQIANFHCETNIPEEKIVKAINSKLSNDIYVKSCKKVKNDFHARFDAVSRHYIYNVSNKFCPFNHSYEWYLNWKNIDLDILNRCSDIIRGKHDFKNFCKSSSIKDSNICIVEKSIWTFNEHKMLYEIIANRFLHHMVRFLVGTMIEVSRGRISLDDFIYLLKGDDNQSKILCAPPKGLFLKKIQY